MTQPQIPRIGDKIRVLSGQRGIEAINKMVGGVYEVTEVHSEDFYLGKWAFPNIPKLGDDLNWEFAE